MKAACLALAIALIGHGEARAAATAWIGDERAAIRLVTADDAIGADREIQAGLQFRLKAGWLTYWRSPGEAGIAPKLDWAGSDNLGTVTIGWPPPTRHVTSGLRSNVYDHDVTLPLTLEVARPGAPARLRASVDFAVCANICIPYRAALSLDLPSGPSRASPEAALIAAARARVPVGPAAAGLAIVLTRQTTTPSGVVLSILVRSDAAPFEAPAVFAELGGHDAPASVRLADDGSTAWLRIAVPLPDGERQEEAGRSPRDPGELLLTLVDGGRAAQWSVPQDGAAR